MEAEHGKLDYKDSSDDEEVKLLPHIRDVREASDTLRDEWLLKTEPLHGARPKWHGGGGGDLQWCPNRLGFWTQKPLGV